MRGTGSRLYQSLSPSSPIATVIGVFTPPGCTELTRMFLRPSSSAAILVRPRTPHFDAVYDAAYGVPHIPLIEVMLTMAPPPLRAIAPPPCFSPRKVPMRLMSMVRRNSRATS